MNTKAIKMKIEDWYDKLIFNLRHIKGNTCAFFEGLSRWFAYRKTLMMVRDFDYSSILYVERLQITRVRDCIAKYQNHLNWERDVRHMNLALKLLDIIEEDGCSERVGNCIKFKLDEKYGTYSPVDDPEAYYTIPVYVNTRNYKRFFRRVDPKTYEDPKYGNLRKDYLRLEKAWCLYHKVRTYYLRNWWD